MQHKKKYTQKILENVNTLNNDLLKNRLKRIIIFVKMNTLQKFNSLLTESNPLERKKIAYE